MNKLIAVVCVMTLLGILLGCGGATPSVRERPQQQAQKGERKELPKDLPKDELKDEPKKDADIKDAQKEPPKDLAKPIKVSAPQLYKAYQENEIRAEREYTGKTVELIGEVVAVKRDYLELNEEDRSNQVGLVHVYVIGKSKDKLASLNKGQRIRVKGTCVGKTARGALFVVPIKDAELLD